MPGRYLDPFTPPNHFPRLNFTPKVVFLLKNIKHHPVQNSPTDEEGDRDENKTGTNISPVYSMSKDPTVDLNE